MGSKSVCTIVDVTYTLANDMSPMTITFTSYGALVFGAVGVPTAPSFECIGLVVMGTLR
jgi:hypothetical protein